MQGAADLGAGPGFQSIPLARLGFEVTAIDTCEALLGELAFNAGELHIRTINDDLLLFRKHCPAPLELIVCMGDTLTHLESPEAVKALIRDAAAALEPGGRLVLTFRDLSGELRGLDRFIPVRSDDNAIFTCFLEYEPAKAVVHDLLYVKTPDGWSFQKSSYRKLRLSAASVETFLIDCGFALEVSEMDRGMATIIAKLPA